MRVQTRYPFQDVVEEALSATRNAFAAQGLGGFTTAPESTPPQVFTTAGTDEDGNVMTLYPAMTELDSTQTGAVTS